MASLIRTVSAAALSAAIASLPAVAQPSVNSIAAAGTNSSNATLLTGVINFVTTVAANTGVKLWSIPIGAVIYVYNLGANDLLVYPPTGHQFYGFAVDQGAPISTGGSVGVFVRRATAGAENWVVS